MRRRISSVGAITSGPMPSPASTAMWKAVLADMGVSGMALMQRAAANEYVRASVRKGSIEGLMPRFAANLGYLFTDRPLLERIDAAAAAGFKAIELQFPYDVPASR